ncbi:MAG: 1-deoxy-D-xylulose-5-phosphate synthase [Bacteroidales bacterium]|jgi:1-deoxy-D-xylulose-5-phosphate synthase|nr:1-deoxy-D-xylulose-5-phosphate synthase [Bacteroidales bacterium]
MKEYIQGELLRTIANPQDVKRLEQNKLPKLCNELRDYIISVLSENSGHLASSLGAVELCVALHYVFDVPRDTLIWDVGHQAYAHKILTGRRDSFPSIRSFQGISGFPRRDESPYDCFGTGHASTSISASLGMAIADALQNDKTQEHQHIAVIGDGSMTGGMAFEALNHAGTSNANLLVILNDNGIAIDKSAGSLSSYLTQITASAKYNRIKNKVWNMLGGNTLAYAKHKTLMKKWLTAFKYVFSGKSTFFEALNVRYFGPINGNDTEDLIKTLRKLMHIKGAKILHIITVKGKGMPMAEQNPTTYHSPGLFNAKTGEIEQTNTAAECPPKYQEVFGETIIELAERDKRVIGITPAMLSGCSLDKMMKRFPERTFDVGIAEEHAVTLAAGMAARGSVPFCNIYSTFMQRAFDQIIHDVCLQNLHLVLCLDRAGLVGADGATHHGAFDLAYLRLIPNITVAAPYNEMELRNMMLTALETDTPFAIRYPRGEGSNVLWHNDMELIPIGRGVCLDDSNGKAKIAVLFLGTVGLNAQKAAEILRNEGIDIALYNYRFLKPLDTTLTDEIFTKYNKIITLEDGVISGGFGSAIAEYATEKGFNGNIVRLGLPDSFVQHGSISQLQHLCGIDCDSIAERIRQMLQ